MKEHCAKCDELAIALEPVALLLRILQSPENSRDILRYQESLDALAACIRGYCQHDD